MLLCLVYTVYISSGDVGLFVECAHFIVMVSNLYSTALYSLWNKKHFDRMFEIVGSDFFDYGDTYDSIFFNNLVNKWRYTSKSRKRIVSNLYVRTIFVVSVVHCIIRPMFDWLTGKYEGVKTSDGIVRTLPIAFWFPFDPDSNAHFIGAHLYEYYGTFLVIICVLCLELPLISFTEELCSEFELLAKGLRSFCHRAQALYKIRHGKEPKEKDSEFEECIRICLRDSVRHHVILIRFARSLRRIQYAPLATGTLAATLLLCFSAVLFTDESFSISVKVNFLAMLVGELVYAFLFCWYAQKVQDASCLPCQALYDSEWIGHYKTVKPFMIMITSCTSKPLTLSAAGFLSVSLITFSEVCRTAYSYFSLLKAVND
ncbi:odorant receptor 4-like [Rhodnius prolixus]